MSVSVHRRPAAVLAVSALLTAGLAAPASASPWSDAWSRLSGWFSGTPLGALWADGGVMTESAEGPRQVVGHQGMLIDPNGLPVNAQSDQGMMVDPNGVPRP